MALLRINPNNEIRSLPRYGRVMDYTIDQFGRVVLDGEKVFELWFQGGNTEGAVVEQDDDVIRFNDQCTERDKLAHLLTMGAEPEPHSERTKRWIIPEEFLNLDITEYCLTLCSTDEERRRVKHEMQLFQFYNMIPVLQALVYMVDVFRKKKIVWGIGRGSSVASFVLYLIGVHKIDSIRFGLEVEDFLR